MVGGDGARLRPRLAPGQGLTTSEIPFNRNRRMADRRASPFCGVPKGAPDDAASCDHVAGDACVAPTAGGAGQGVRRTSHPSAGINVRQGCRLLRPRRGRRTRRPCRAGRGFAGRDAHRVGARRASPFCGESTCAGRHRLLRPRRGRRRRRPYRGAGRSQVVVRVTWRPVSADSSSPDMMSRTWWPSSPLAR